jgi:phosphoglycolate phosphatase
VIFDLDGTLVDSLDDIRGALVATTRPEGFADPDRETVRDWVGGGARELIAFAYEAHHGRALADDDHAHVDRLLADFRVRYREVPILHSKLYDGIAAVLDALVAAGRPIAVLSNKPHDLTQMIGGELLAPWPFVTINGHHPGGPLKPDRAACAPVLAALGAPASACTYVGDSDLDVAFARACGMRAVSVSWGFRARAELHELAPDALVDRPDALLGAL